MLNRNKLILLIALSAQASTSMSDEMIRNGSFTNGIDGWWTSGGNIIVKDQRACMQIANPGENPWSVIIGHAGIGLEKGETYQIRFDAYANIDTQVKTLIQHEGPPYTHHFVTDTVISSAKQPYHYTFTQEQDSDAGAEFQFQMGAQKEADICISNVSIDGKPYIETDTKSAIRLNQLGFLPKADKFIFVASESKEPLRWTLQNQQGINIDLGRTSIFGLNKASGEHLHRIDLSSITAEQKRLSIKVGEHKSTSFDISPSIYQDLKYDAFSYFYQNRSGINIEEEFVQRPDLARPAGHLKDLVTCYNKKDAWGNDWPGCDFSIDVSRGWYDAGDHGKYTVNSGISTWTLLNLYERGKWLATADIPLVTEKALIPEDSQTEKAVNPVLSEARWNIEFMLAMQIPEGKIVSVPLANQSNSKTLNLTKIDASHLAFHKVADEVWTGMPLPPHKDDKTRYVGQPTTAATLNLATIGAQCSRIWSDIDPDFAKQCLTVAENAWQAAQKFPEIYAYDNFTGSGPYDDFSLTDEFYWASAELFITTGKNEYQEFLKASPHYLETPLGNLASQGDIFWQYTAPLGTISLAIVPNQLGTKSINLAQQNIIKTAKSYQVQIDNEGYRIPYSVEQYPWGSNSNLVNRGLFLIYANDFTADISFVKVASNAMDYLLGANPMDISYITGYGIRSAQNPHHRFWAKSADENSPSPAPGALVGGPNSINFSDPIACHNERQVHRPNLLPR
ncbi:glycoside hydrolase family 9 protein [Psychromonas sp. KJ10-10]|uniref:glycoside hydrolase family 9 protein n=1 Tax=Psychromonas sp. KJ10-10 TaxID=3391823 RepID=UPI0039B47BFF